jgi:hypothetical protein
VKVGLGDWVGPVSGLLQFPELCETDAKLTENFEKEGRTNLPAAVEGNRDRAAVRMISPLVTSSLSGLGETETAGRFLKFPRRGARHARSRWNRWAGACGARGTQWRSC